MYTHYIGNKQQFRSRKSADHLRLAINKNG